MSDLHESKRYDLIDMFNDTSRYLDDTTCSIFTIDMWEGWARKLVNRPVRWLYVLQLTVLSRSVIAL